jgi:hypothetical protein
VGTISDGFGGSERGTKSRVGVFAHRLLPAETRWASTPILHLFSTNSCPSLRPLCLCSLCAIHCDLRKGHRDTEGAEGTRVHCHRGKIRNLPQWATLSGYNTRPLKTVLDLAVSYDCFVLADGGWAGSGDSSNRGGCPVISGVEYSASLEGLTLVRTYL